MKNIQELQDRINEQEALIEKMKFQLTRSLESIIELMQEINRLKKTHES